MKLIDKSALVAEIENLIDEIYKGQPFDSLSREKQVALWYIRSIMSSVNSLEVKEVDLEANIQDYINSNFTEGCDGGMISDWYKVLGGVHYNDLKEIAKHFFELGMAVSNKEEKGE